MEQASQSSTDARADTFRIYGQQLPSSRDQRHRLLSGGRRIPFQMCYCVHDSLDSPCKCMHDETWWLLENSIKGRGVAKQHGDGGEQLDYLDLLLDADVMIETAVRVSVKLLSEIGSDLHKSGGQQGGTLAYIYSSKMWDVT